MYDVEEAPELFEEYEVWFQDGYDVCHIPLSGVVAVEVEVGLVIEAAEYADEALEDSEGSI